MVVVALVPALVVAGTAALVYAAFNLTVNASGWVSHTTAVLASAGRVQVASQEALSTERGFALTGATEYLVAFGGASIEVGRRLDDLRALVSDNPAQVQHIANVSRLMDDWRLHIAAQVIGLRRARDDGPPASPESELAAITAVIASPANESLRRKMEAEWEIFLRSERELLTARVTRYERIVRWTRVVTVGCPLVAMFFASIFSLRGVSQLRRSLEGISAAARDFAAGNRGRRAAMPEIREVRAVAVAFNNMSATLEQSENEWATLRKFVDLLAACRDVDEAAEVTCSIGRRLFPGGGALFMANPSRNAFVPLLSWGPVPEVYLHPFHLDDCWALRRGKSFEASPTESNALACRHLTAQADVSTLCVPLVAQGDAMGLLVLRWALSEPGVPAIPPGQGDLAHAFSEHLALALANLRLREHLLAQSIRDALTGLYNRRYLEETLERELSRARRSGIPVGIVVLDVDNFKTFNDTHGHGGGDALLRALGETMRSLLRREDIACRYGGEEFVLVLPGATLADTERRAEDLRRTVCGLKVSDNGRTLGAVSISSGVAAFPEHGEDVDLLVRVADSALFEAKRLGRNRVIVAGGAAGPAPVARPVEPVEPLQ